MQNALAFPAHVEIPMMVPLCGVLCVEQLEKTILIPQNLFLAKGPVGAFHGKSSWQLRVRKMTFALSWSG